MNGVNQVGDLVESTLSVSANHSKSEQWRTWRTLAQRLSQPTSPTDLRTRFRESDRRGRSPVPRGLCLPATDSARSAPCSPVIPIMRSMRHGYSAPSPT